MKHLTLVFLLLSFSTFSQEKLSIDLKHSNELNGGITVHTIMTNIPESSVSKDTDTQKNIDVAVNKILAELQDMNGVTRATFDEATGLITLISNSSQDLELQIVELNEKLQRNEL